MPSVPRGRGWARLDRRGGYGSCSPDVRPSTPLGLQGLMVWCAVVCVGSAIVHIWGQMVNLKQRDCGPNWEQNLFAQFGLTEVAISVS